MKLNKKALKPGMMNTVIMSIIVLVVLFQAYAVIVPLAQTQGSSMNDSNRCVALGCSYNKTGRVTNIVCYNTTTYNESTAVACKSNYKQIPLSSLVTGTGVVFVIIMAALIILVTKSFLTKGK